MVFLKSRLFWLFIGPYIVFGGIALLTPATGFITVLNTALVALALGVCLAYGLPVVALFSPATSAPWIERINSVSAFSVRGLPWS
jgi:hypothetical protein